MARYLLLASLPLLLVASSVPAAAMVGGARAAPDSIARSVVLIVGSRGNFCTGAALARDLVLTAAHCVLPGADYKIVEFDAARQPQLRDVRERDRASEIRSRRPCWRTARPRTWRCSSSPRRSLACEPAACSGARLHRRAGRRLHGRGHRRRGARRRQVGRNRARRRSSRPAGPGTCRSACSIPRPGREAGARRLHRRLRRAGVRSRAGGRPAVIGVVSWSTGPAKRRAVAAG